MTACIQQRGNCECAEPVMLGGVLSVQLETGHILFVGLAPKPYIDDGKYDFIVELGDLIVELAPKP